MPLTSDPVVAPTKDVLRVATLIGELADRVLEGYAPHTRICRRYSDVEAHAMLWLVIRNAESVCYLAQIDLALFPGAIASARACFEIAVRAVWILQPDNPDEREARWLAHLESEEDHHARMARRLREVGKSAGALPNLAEVYSRLRSSLTAQLPSGITKLGRAPNLDQMLRSLNHAQYYAHYMRLSQYAHGTHFAGRLYRRETDEGALEVGEFVSPKDWYDAFGAAAVAVRSIGERIITLHGGDLAKALPSAFLQEVQTALQRLRTVPTKS